MPSSYDLPAWSIEYILYWRFEQASVRFVQHKDPRPSDYDLWHPQHIMRIADMYVWLVGICGELAATISSDTEKLVERNPHILALYNGLKSRILDASPHFKNMLFQLHEMCSFKSSWMQRTS